jgi:enediyne biosynthesis protein E3
MSRLPRQELGQVDFGLRRFRLRPGPARQVLESAARAFLIGLNAVSDGDLVERLDAMAPEHIGFACEGAGMGAAMLDLVTLGGGRRVAALLAGPAAAHPPLVHVGIGWAYARLRLRPGPGSPAADPLLRWLAWDGFGFHQGFFHADRVIGGQRVEWRLPQAARAVRDQGLGRALWFHECAEPDGVALRIAEFGPDRRADLWSGIGLAATYAGGARADELSRLRELAGPYRAQLAQGCAFACKARLAGQVVPEHTELAARVLADTEVATAAGWTDEARAALTGSTLADYQRWRAGIRQLWERAVPVR